MNNIKKIRKSRGLTQKQLAEMIGSSFQQIQKLEKGERRLAENWLLRLSEALNVNPIEIMELGERRADWEKSLPKDASLRDPILDSVMGAVYAVWFDDTYKDKVSMERLPDVVHTLYNRVVLEKTVPPQQELRKRVADMLAIMASNQTQPPISSAPDNRPAKQ